MGRFGVPLQPLQPAIRTFKSDIAEALKGPKASLAKIAIAEQEKARLASQPKGKAKPFVVPTVAVPMTPSPNVDPSISHNIKNDQPGAGPVPVAAVLNQEPQQNPSNKGPLAQAQQPPPELPAIPKKPIVATPGVKTFVVPQAALLTPEDAPAPKDYRWLKALGYLFASLIFIAGGGYGAWYMYTHSIVSKMSAPIPQPTVRRYASTISTDTQKTVAITSAEPERIRNAIQDAFHAYRGNINEVFAIIPVNEASQQLLAADTVPYIFESLPGSVSRSTGDPYTIGGIVRPLGNSAFIVWYPTYFQGSLAGFLDWETTLPQEAHQFFPHSLEYQINFFNLLPKIENSSSSTVATTTAVATTTPQNPPSPITTTDTLRHLTTAQWRDLIYKNKDVRVLRNQAGEIIMLYSFIDTQTVVITDTLDTFSEVLRRYEKTSYKR
jgi:hypothetical protein